MAWPGYASCQRISIIKTKSEEQENRPVKAVLDADHLMVGGENVFSPKPELVMLVLPAS